MDLSLPPLPDGPVLVAFSGGLDSTVLLHRLAADPVARAAGLRALHVDHGLHADSPDWAASCRVACEQLGLPFATERVEVTPAGEGLEAAAREARHAAFARHLRPGETLALAHHRDDQAETVLLRLLRGAGEGLAAMQPMRDFAAGRLWRPLLALPRSALLAYAKAHGLRWIEDPSNASERHDRNFLRHRVRPVLAGRWPQADAALARSAALLADQAALLAGEETRRLAQVQGLDPATLSVPALLAQAPAWRDRLLRAWLAGLGLPPLPTDALGTLARELLDAGPDAEPVFAWSGAELRRWRDQLHAGPARTPLAPDWQAHWAGDTPLRLPTGDILSLDPPSRFDAPVQARARHGGERLVLPGRNHHTTLKHALQDLGVPPWERRRLPLLFAHDGELLAAGDLVVSASLRAWLQARGVRLRLEGFFFAADDADRSG